MIHHGDHDCFYFGEVRLSDEEIAHRIAQAHADQCPGCDYEEIEWSVKR